MGSERDQAHQHSARLWIPAGCRARADESDGLQHLNRDVTSLPNTRVRLRVAGLRLTYQALFGSSTDTVAFYIEQRIGVDADHPTK
jgi:hypothetical protein